MKGAIADPAVRTISTPKVSKMTISGNNQNFFLTRRKPQRSLMNSIIVFPLLIRFLYIFPGESMISNEHYRSFTRLEVLQFQRTIPRSFRARPIGVTTVKKTSVKRALQSYNRERASGPGADARWEIKRAHNRQSRDVAILP